MTQKSQCPFKKAGKRQEKWFLYQLLSLLRGEEAPDLHVRLWSYSRESKACSSSKQCQTSWEGDVRQPGPIGTESVTHLERGDGNFTIYFSKTAISYHVLFPQSILKCGCVNIPNFTGPSNWSLKMLFLNPKGNEKLYTLNCIKKQHRHQQKGVIKLISF